MSPPYCPETNIRESGTRFSYISFWAEFRVQKLIYENRVPDYRIFVSGRSFLPPFYFSWGEALGSFGEAVWEASGRLLGGFCAPLPGASSVCIYIAKPPRSLHLRTPSGSFISMYLQREASKKPPFPTASSVCIYIDLPARPAQPGHPSPAPGVKAIPSHVPLSQYIVNLA